jgi:DNA transformation protein
MPDGIGSLPNLGPYMARHLAEVDVRHADDLRALGAVEAYARLRFRFGREISLNALWAMDAALADIDWRHITAERKTILKQQIERRNG